MEQTGLEPAGRVGVCLPLQHVSTALSLGEEERVLTAAGTSLTDQNSG